MLIPFTKMQGAGNDFVVLDETRTPLNLSREQYRFIANRRFGVGADQILSVRPATSPDVDFSYVIHNADGGMVEHCGNGARCFVRFVLEQGLTTKTSIRVQVQRGIITLHAQPDGQVTVDMGAPVFDAPALPFEPDGLAQHQQGQATLYTLLPLLPRAQGAQGTQPAAATAPQTAPATDRLALPVPTGTNCEACTLFGSISLPPAKPLNSSFLSWLKRPPNEMRT